MQSSPVALSAGQGRQGAAQGPPRHRRGLRGWRGGCWNKFRIARRDQACQGGYNVYPRVIEDALYEHPDVAEATVIGVPDAYRGEAPKAFVKLRAGAVATPLALRDFLRDKVSKIELPREIEIRDELPKTLTGKLSKKELRDA